MIVTVLLLTNKLSEFVKKHFSELHNYDVSIINLIESSVNVNQPMTDSAVIYYKFDSFSRFVRKNFHNVKRRINNHNNDLNSMKACYDFLFMNKSMETSINNEQLGTGLSSHRKMDCNTGANNLPLPGPTVGTGKPPVSPRGIITSPESDCNSNNLTVTNDTALYFNNEKFQDCHDFFQDNSDYQWFLEYGYKDNSHHHQSVFSILSSHDMMHYDDLARDLDANLAEVDMEDFHREDIHSVLSTLPNMCPNDLQGLEEREMYASMSESMMIKFNIDSSSPHSSSQQEGNSNSASMCKSELLFSPVRESYLPNANLSIDSLDLSENDINLLITCQANKNNYTIAFEGSTVMGSDDSDFHDNGGNTVKCEESFEITNDIPQSRTEKRAMISNLNNSMVRSDYIYTTWSKIKQLSNEQLQLRQIASRNNNTVMDTHYAGIYRSSNAKKSISLPNLFNQRQSLRSGLSSRMSCDFSSGSENGPSYLKSNDSVEEVNKDKPPNLNLVKLFIKQKSASHEGMCNYFTERALNVTNSEIYTNDVVNNSLEADYRKNLNNVLLVKPVKINWTAQCKKSVPECSISGFEDSLISKNYRRREPSQEYENSDSESVKQIIENSKLISESVEHSTKSSNSSKNSNINVKTSHTNNHIVNVKDLCAFNVNNNNSVLNSNINNNSNSNNNNNNKSKYSSDESTQENGSNTESAEHITSNVRKTHPSKTRIYSMEKSIQTSKLLENADCNEKHEIKVPAYILYPNYSLPNLEFLKEKHYIQNIDFTKIFLRPQNFKQNESTSIRKKSKISDKRPLSVGDIENLKKTGFKHVRDWDSLTFLLPKEYKEFLQEIPEITAQIKDKKNMNDDLKPLFCINTERKKIKKRPISCDCNFFKADCRNSNFSSTATQPSSGYRGSSTMLNSNYSVATPSPRNPSVGFKYDSNDSVFNSRRNIPLRSGSVLNSLDSDEPPPRPPLPKGILRNNSLDCTKYTCKTQKENANKRYSMIEFGERNFDTCINKFNRRRSTQDPYYLKSPQKNVKEYSAVKSGSSTEEHLENECENGKSEKWDEDNSLSFKSSSLDSDMRRLEELLEISTVFGESIESFSDQDMTRLRSQVSKFLSMQKNLQRVSECLQTVNENKGANFNILDEDDRTLYKENQLHVKNSLTPNNTPEHKQKRCLVVGEGYETDIDASLCLKCNIKECQDSDPWGEYEKEEINNYKEDALRGLKKTVSFAEKISLMKERYSDNKDLTPPNSPTPTALHTSNKTYQGKSLKLVSVPICEESCEGSPNDSPKRVTDSSSSSQKRGLVLDVKNAVQKILSQINCDNDKSQEELSNVCLHHLCPSLYAILSDGLKEEMDTPFGPIRNSVWSVIEASSQQGPLTETLNHLVQRLNRDDILTEGLVKFNAFIFGLLNVNSLDAWLSYLRTRDSLLHKYYHPKGLLLLSNSAGAPVRALMNELISIVRPLSEFKFKLDLMYQAKLLHQSLQNLNSLLEGNNDLLSPTKHLMLLKLVHSIQNSINQPPDGRKEKCISEEIEKLTPDSPVLQLLEKSFSSKPHKMNKPRPRSGCDILNSDNACDVAGSVKKRWSGVQYNSKLLQAFERLREETESEYTDSLDNTKENCGKKSPSYESASKRLHDSNNTFDDVSNTWNDSESSEILTRVQKKNILSNLNKKSNRLEDLKTDVDDNDRIVKTTGNEIHSGSHIFKRLQQKWEKLNGKSSSGNNTPAQGSLSPARSSKISTPKHQFSERVPGSNGTLISPSTRISRIPRPVSSPSQMTPTNEKQCVSNKKLTSPTKCSNNVHIGNSVRATGNTSEEVKSRTSACTRLSRFDDVSDQKHEGNTRNRAVRPSSLPYRGPSTMPVKRNVPARASSVSLNRKPEKKTVKIPRFVRTLSHRLPSDSGHLSFNEGEKLKVVLEVDETWLLCCRGTQKGLVPKSTVIAVPEHIKY